MTAKTRKFDTKVQHLKYKVLREVARHAWNGTLFENLTDIPKQIVPGNVPTMRCCVYKERAILGERVKLAIGGDASNPNVIEVIDIACDECPVGGYDVTDACRGCLAHRCEDVCRRGAISFDHQQKAHIDKSKCVECGACAKVCPYSAIMNYKRPCENACKVKAISMSETKAAKIDLRRLRISVSLRSHIRQIIHPERHRSDKKERREQGIQGLRCCCAFYLKPVYLRKARSGHNRDKGSRLPHRC